MTPEEIDGLGRGSVIRKPDGTLWDILGVALNGANYMPWCKPLTASGYDSRSGCDDWVTPDDLGTCTLIDPLTLPRFAKAAARKNAVAEVERLQAELTAERERADALAAEGAVLLESATLFNLGVYRLPNMEHHSSAYPIWLEHRKEGWVIYQELGGNLTNTHCLNADGNWKYKHGTAFESRDAALSVWYTVGGLDTTTPIIAAHVAMHNAAVAVADALEAYTRDPQAVWTPVRESLEAYESAKASEQPEQEAKP